MASPNQTCPRTGQGQQKRREGRAALRSPLGRRTDLRSWAAGLASRWPRSLRLTPSRLEGTYAAPPGRATDHPASSENTYERPPSAIRKIRDGKLGREAPKRAKPGQPSHGWRVPIRSAPGRGRGNKKTRREPLEEPSAPVQAPSRTGRRASHLDGLALCVSTFASAGEPTQRSRRRARPHGPATPQSAGKCGALAASIGRRRRPGPRRSRSGR
jgi:hypothetical protein